MRSREHLRPAIFFLSSLFDNGPERRSARNGKIPRGTAAAAAAAVCNPSALIVFRQKTTITHHEIPGAQEWSFRQKHASSFNSPHSHSTKIETFFFLFFFCFLIFWVARGVVTVSGHWLILSCNYSVASFVIIRWRQNSFSIIQTTQNYCHD